MEGDAADWYYIFSGEQRGPVPEATIRGFLKTGVLEPSTPVWTSSMVDWAPATVALSPQSGDADIASGSELAWFYPVPRAKFVVMSIMTLGLYEIYWCYRNWGFIKSFHGLKISPFWRAWFALFFTHSLLRRIKSDIQEFGGTADYRSNLLATVYIVIAYASSPFPAPYFFVAFFSWVALLPVLDAVNDANAARGLVRANARYTGWDAAGILLGGVSWILLVMSLFLPPVS